MDKPKLFAALLFAYVLSIAFQDALKFQGFYRKVQFPEMIFLLLLVVYPWNYFRTYRFDRADRWLAGALAVYWLANIVSSVISGNFSAIAESVGRIYLLLLFGMVTAYCAQLPKAELRLKAINTSIMLGVVLAVTCMVAFFAYLFKFTDKLPIILGSVFNDYPYFGAVYRVRGFTHSADMVASIFSIAMVLAAVNIKELGLSNKKYIAVFSLMFIALFLTLSRSIILVLFGIGLLLLFQKKGFSQRIFRLATGAAALIMILGTHFIFISKNNPKLPALLNSSYTSNIILFEYGNFEILETCYCSMKRAALILWGEKPVFGIGTGNALKGVERLQTIGLYPQKLPSYEFHSSYLSVLTENGIFGAAALIVFFGLLWHRITRFDFIQKKDNFLIALLLCLTIVFIESIALDTMNFRHYWLLYALIWAYTKPSSVPLAM